MCIWIRFTRYLAAQIAKDTFIRVTSGRFESGSTTLHYYLLSFASQISPHKSQNEPKMMLADKLVAAAVARRAISAGVRFSSSISKHGGTFIKQQQKPKQLQNAPAFNPGSAIKPVQGADALSRRAAIRTDILPAKYEPHMLTKLQRGSYITLFAITSGLVLVMYMLTGEDDELTATDKMHVLAQVLRRHRAVAKDELLSAATDSGEFSVRMGKHIKWWASGPRDADTFILLRAEDGETAALWGYVHSALAQQLCSNPTPQGKVRVISFHRAGASPSAAHSTPLSLRISDTTAVIERVCLAGKSASDNASGWGSLWRGSSNPASPPRVVLISQGEGSWGALASAGLQDHARSANSYIIAGTVLVAPLQFNRGAYQAWYEAILDASRLAPSEANPGLLKQLLAARPVKDDLEATDPARAAVAKTQAALPSSDAARTAFRMDAFINKNKAVEKALKKEAEAARKRRAAMHVLSSLEQQFLDGAVGGIGLLSSSAAVGAHPPEDAALPTATSSTRSDSSAGTSLPVVTALTFSEQALPPFVHRLRRTSAAAWWLQAANSIGIAMLPEPERGMLRRKRLEAVACINAGGLDAVVNSDSAAPGATSAVAELPSDAAADVAATAFGSAGSAATAAPLAAAAEIATSVTTTLSSALSATGSALHAGYQGVVDATPTSKPEEAFVRRGLRLLPMALSLAPPPNMETEPWYRYLATQEAPQLPTNFRVATVGGADMALPNSAPEAATLSLLPRGYQRAVVSLPLQCPQAIVGEVSAIVNAQR